MSTMCQYWWEALGTHKGRKRLGKITVIEFRIHWHFSRNKLQQYYLQWLRYGSNPSVDQWTKGSRSCNWYIYTHTHTPHTQWNITDICVCIYIYTTHTKEYYSVIKDVVAATWMDLEGIMLSETNQTEKDKYMYVWLLHTWNLEHITN